MSLLAKRKEIMDLHKTFEKVPESPWHPSHPLMKERVEKGELKLSDRPIGFICDDKHIVVGDCVPKMLGFAKSFIDSLKNVDSKVLTGEQKWALKVCKELKADTEKQLVLSGREWNGLMYALTEQNVQAISADGGVVSDE